jgi:hypothetical protein
MVNLRKLVTLAAWRTGSVAVLELLRGLVFVPLLFGMESFWPEAKRAELWPPYKILHAYPVDLKP